MGESASIPSSIISSTPRTLAGFPFCAFINLLWSHGWVHLPSSGEWARSHLLVMAPYLWPFSTPLCRRLLEVSRFSSAFVVITDASEVELAAILGRELENIGHPALPVNVSCCCYADSDLLPGEWRCSVSERERTHFAMKWAARVWWCDLVEMYLPLWQIIIPVCSWTEWRASLVE